MCFIRQKEKLEDEHEPECGIEGLGAMRELGTNGPEFLVHWEAGWRYEVTKRPVGRTSQSSQFLQCGKGWVRGQGISV